MPDIELPEFLERTQRLFGREALLALHGRKVAVAGCGGVGGAASLLLTRMGIERFHLADPGKFDAPDQNRQWGANATTLGRNKAQVHEELVRAIAPKARLRTFAEGVTDANLETFLEGCDLLIDSLDLAVPAALRQRLYERAHALKMPAISAPIIGVGTLMAVSMPPGPSLSALGQVLGATLAVGQLPPRLYELFPPPHLDALMRSLREQRAPSNSISVAVATAATCTEAVMALTGPGLPGWRPPIALPSVTVLELAGPNLTVLDIGELFPKPTVEKTPSSETDGAQRRQAMLEAVGNNVFNLPAGSVEVDVLTDSWNERNDWVPPPPRAFAPKPEEVLKPLYGFPHVLTVFRGRFAESLVCKVLFQPGTSVAINALFPTTMFHLTAAGARPVYVGADDGVKPCTAEFRGDVDLTALERAASEPGLKAVYLELCSNALGGQPVSLANLKAVRELTQRRGQLLILDATRAFENAALIRERERGQSGQSLAALVRRSCELADVCVASLCKDFRATKGAFLAVRDPALAASLIDLTLLGHGDGLDAGEKAALGRALVVDQEGSQGAAGRVARVKELAQELQRLGVPVAPAGGHGVFVDASALLKPLPEGADAAATLCAALYTVGGVRAAPHLGTPQQQAAGVQWVRLALPLGIDLGTTVQHVSKTFAGLTAERATIHPLTPRAPLMPGKLGEMVRPYGRC